MRSHNGGIWGVFRTHEKARASIEGAFEGEWVLGIYYPAGWTFSYTIQAHALGG